MNIIQQKVQYDAVLGGWEKFIILKLKLHERTYVAYACVRIKTSFSFGVCFLLRGVPGLNFSLVFSRLSSTLTQTTSLPLPSAESALTSQRQYIYFVSPPNFVLCSLDNGCPSFIFLHRRNKLYYS